MLYSLFISITFGILCGLGYACLFRKGHQTILVPVKDETSNTHPRKIILFSIFFFFARYGLLAATLFFLVYILDVQPLLFLTLFLSSFLGAVYLAKG